MANPVVHFEVIGHDAQVLTPKELQTLRGLYMEIREGSTTMYEVLTALDREIRIQRFGWCRQNLSCALVTQLRFSC